MKVLFCSIIVLSLGFYSFSQTDPMLVNRLAKYTQAIHLLNAEKVLDFIYPPFFAIVPKQDILGAFETKTDIFSLHADSLKTDSIYPIFVLQNASYAKVNCT